MRAGPSLPKEVPRIEVLCSELVFARRQFNFHACKKCMTASRFGFCRI